MDSDLKDRWVDEYGAQGENTEFHMSNKDLTVPHGGITLKEVFRLVNLLIFQYNGIQDWQYVKGSRWDKNLYLTRTFRRWWWLDIGMEG